MSGWIRGAGVAGGVAALLLLGGCRTLPAPSERLAAATALAAGAGLLPWRTPTPSPLPLAGFARLGCPGQALHVYIEGDGLAWVTPTQPSADPTPLAAVGLELATRDPACNVLYLGRPGQYGAPAPARYWLGARFAANVVDSYLVALRDVQAAQAAPRLQLAGFSGGGAVAALVAARLAEEGRTVSLYTIAGNLDPDAWTRGRKLSPLQGSLNPVREAAILATVPQHHLVGRDDRQVPPWVLQAYRAALPETSCVSVQEVAAGHHGPWAAAWAQALARPPACASAVPGPSGPAAAAGEP